MKRWPIYISALFVFLAQWLAFLFAGNVVAMRRCMGTCENPPFSWWWVLIYAPPALVLIAMAVGASRRRARYAWWILGAATGLAAVAVAFAFTDIHLLQSLQQQ